MRILIIGYMHSKYEKRVFKTVEILSKNFEVIYQYWTDKDEKRYIEGNISYIPVKYEKRNNKNIIHEYFRRKNFDKVLFDLIKNSDYDIVYFHHFLQSLPVKAFKAAKKKGKVVIYDIHEYHPENFLSFLKGLLKRLKEKIMLKIFEKQIKLSDKLVFVSKEIQEDIFKTLSINKPYLIVPNYAHFSVSAKEKKKEIVLVGKTPRNIEREKEIIKRLISYGFKFKIIGIDSEHFKDIPHEYTSFLPYEDMMKGLSKSAFSLISYGSFGNEEKNYIYSLPHKFFDSIAAGTPVIVRRDFVSMAKEVKNYNIGVIIDPNNVEDSVKRILKAYENYNELLKNVEKFKNLYIWDKEKEENFLNFITNFNKITFNHINYII